ncbi:hypothetical protein KQI82_12470 [Oscillibacter sp. MSJ-2]|uniref:Uncharacterized protein n=1 Tax=Dysosmobacter acutus TaxID=2841504 RepID=A0ABS6FBR5_9FIRM|nr:hypothetical protein [Dysosmobacter acutus]MBU5626522.1 hypothetical protein [Dysosmobacter acutus]MBU5627724.1 hypothetical protein [Dysosmobacter acutus]
MNRLTMWHDGCHAICTDDDCSSERCPFADAPCERVQDVIDRLAAYEDAIPFADLPRAAELVKAEKEGRCKIPSCGETVFVLTDSCWWTANLKVEEIIECRVKTHRLTKKGEVKFSVDGIWKSGHPYKASFGATSIGKTVFLTRAEAEAALGGGENG